LRTQLLRMLKREDELRLSPEVQAMYALQPESWTWKWQVTDDVQRRVCQECGFAEDENEGLDLLRSSLSLFPDDEEVKQAAHYLKYNIHTDCPLAVGDTTPNVLLYSLAGETKWLHDLVADNIGCKTVFFVGSHT